MQRDKISTAGHGGAFSSNAASSTASLLNRSNAFNNLTSFYSSILFPHSTELLLDDSQPSTETSVNRHQLLIDQQYHQDLIERHNRVLSQLLETEKKTLALRQENINLKMANFNLNNRLSLLFKASSDYSSVYGPQSGLGLDSVVGGLQMMRVGVGEEESSSEGYSWEDRHQSPTSVMDSGQAESVDREVLPKSISVRSSGYMKTNHAGGSKPQSRSKSDHIAAQRVYVKGGKKEEKPVELEVYNQGMFKTELCNKWQETGTCPYGDNCQFAHGIDELRPVLRHPRYKTEVCRMVLNGDPCPYGHRCHFRHTLTDEEKFMRSLNARSLNH